MFANLSAGAIRIDGLAWTELTALAVRHGFAGVDAPLGEIGLMADPQDATRRLADQGLVWGVMGLPDNFCGTESDFEQAVTTAVCFWTVSTGTRPRSLRRTLPRSSRVASSPCT